jgi:hypothetical protein
VTFPVAAARTTTTEAVAVNSHSIALGSPSAGDLLVVFAAAQNSNGLFFVDKAVSGEGWLISQALGTLSTGRMAALCKIANGGDALTLLTSSAVRMAAVCYRVTGHASAIAGFSFATAFSTNGNPPAASVPGAARDILFLTAMATNSSVASAAPASYGSLTTANSGTAFMSAAERALNGTTDDPGGFTNVLQEVITTTVAIPETVGTTAVRQTQEAVETLSNATPAARLTQISTEVVSRAIVDARLSQIVVEMVSTNVPDDTFSTQPVMLFIAT